jgi:6-phosphogluconolactonase
MKDSKKRELLISGYGPEENNKTSIALYELTQNKEVGRKVWEDSLIAPSYLATYRDICFGIQEESGSGSVLCYQRVEEEYVLRDELKLHGGALCHIMYQPADKVLYCSFYETGHVAAVRVEDYHFVKILNFFQILPEQPGELTRAHCAVLEPEGTRVFVTNIALDRIYIYNSAEGELSPDTVLEYIQLEKGVGPRHLKFHPLLNYLYVITEYSNELYVYCYNREDTVIQVKLIQKISTLPEGFYGESSGSALDISKDGRFLYCANRGADTIAVFDITPSGELKKIQDVKCGGRHPRHLALLKDDTGLIVANQHSNEVVIFGVDDNNGSLTGILNRHDFYAPAYAEEV